MKKLLYKDGKQRHEDDVIGGKATITVSNYINSNSNSSSSSSLGLLLGDDDTITTTLVNQIKSRLNSANNTTNLLPVLVGPRSPFLSTVIEKVLLLLSTLLLPLLPLLMLMLTLILL